MTKSTTSLPLLVSANADFAPYIWVRYDQLDDLRRALDSHGIRYRVQEEVISLSGGPFMAVVNLDRGTDPVAVQTILDGIR